MKYVIYEMVQPSQLKEVEQDGYYTKVIYRSVLQILDIPGVEEEHSSMESAISEINTNSKLLKNLNLTILPVFSISWEGEVSVL